MWGLFYTAFLHKLYVIRLPSVRDHRTAVAGKGTNIRHAHQVPYSTLPKLDLGVLATLVHTVSPRTLLLGFVYHREHKLNAISYQSGLKQ